MNRLIMPRNEAWDHLEEALRGARIRLKLVTVASAGGAWVAGTVLFGLLFVVFDHWLSGGVPDGPRVGANRLYLLASAAWLAAAVAWPLTRRINDVYAARLIERWQPEFRNTLVDALQLSRHVELPGSVRAAVMEQAAGQVVDVDVRASVPTRRLRLTASIIAIVAALFGIYAMVSPKPVLPSLKRAFGWGIAPPTRTSISELAPEDGTSVPRGEPVVFRARLTGKRPARAFVRFRPDGGAGWLAGQQLELDPPAGDSPTGVWQGIKAGRDVQRSMAWQVVAGDAASEVRHLEVRPVPEMAVLSLRYDYPDYARLPPATQPGGEIDAMVGTKVTIRASANTPVHDPILITGRPPDEKRRVLTHAPLSSPTELDATLTVVKDDVYWLQYRDGHGEPSREPILYPIRARADKLPTISIDRPGAQTEMLVDEVFNLGARMEDDFGITRAALCYRRVGEQSVSELELPLNSQEQGRAAEIAEQVALSQMNAGPGDVMEWWVSAWDNREDLRGQPAPQRSDSNPRRIVIRERDTVAEEPDEDPDTDRDIGSAVASGEENAGDRGPTPDDSTSANRGAEDVEGTEANGQADDRSDTSREQGPLDAFARAHAGELDTLAEFLSELEEGGTGEQGPASSRPAGSGEDSTAMSGGGEASDARRPEQQAGTEMGSTDQPSPPGSGHITDATGSDSDREAGKPSNSGDGGRPGTSDGRGTGEDGRSASAGGGASEASGSESAKPEVSGDGASSGGTETAERAGTSATGGGGADSGTKTPPLPGKPAEPSGPTARPAVPADVSRQIRPPGRVEPLMDALDRALRTNQVPSEMLDELGWDLARAEQFVENYKRLKIGAQRQVKQTALPDKTTEMETTRDDDRRILRAQGDPGPGVGGLDAVHDQDPDATHELMEVGRQRVPPRYQPLLEAYYQSVTTREAP